MVTVTTYIPPVTSYATWLITNHEVAVFVVLYSSFRLFSSDSREGEGQPLTVSLCNERVCSPGIHGTLVPSVNRSLCQDDLDRQDLRRRHNHPSSKSSDELRRC